MELLLLCLKIFGVRIIDVSLGTCRTIVTVKGNKFVASLIGFVEVFVWFIIVREALNTDETSIFVALSYAGGYATGTYIGGWLSAILIKGNFGVQVITSKKDDAMVSILRQKGYAVSVIHVEGQDKTNERYMLFMEIDKNKFKNLKKLIKSLDDRAFIVVNETREVENGYFPAN